MSEEDYIQCRNYSSCGDFTDGESEFCDDCQAEQSETKQQEEAERLLYAAEQQLQGYTLGKSGLSIVEAVNAMGLVRSEWETLLEQGLVHLDDSDREQLNIYFNMPDYE
ncbi:hypothetical protein [Methylophaga thiooxydans]|uniref:hypothetical protein n=1 Tax=Methylophaga thiooxydans TaxID=392484 RepID=UPI0023554D87|nr:hypothetical protein [Methylophaga thiooxydans]